MRRNERYCPWSLAICLMSFVSCWLVADEAEVQSVTNVAQGSSWSCRFCLMLSDVVILHWHRLPAYVNYQLDAYRFGNDGQVILAFHAPSGASILGPLLSAGSSGSSYIPRTDVISCLEKSKVGSGERGTVSRTTCPPARLLALMNRHYRTYVIISRSEEDCGCLQG